MRKNPQHLWVLQFGVGNRLRRLDTHPVCEGWRTLRRPWERRATYHPSCLGSSPNVQNGGCASGARGIILAVRACEDLQLVAGVVKPLHWRLAKAWAQAEVQEYASPVMLRHLVDRTTSDGERAVVAMALLSYVCFLRVAEFASVWVGDVRDSSSLVFWNSETGHEGWHRRPVPPWVRPFVEWLHKWAEGRGCARDDLLFPAGTPQLEKTMADPVHGTAWSRHRWHCLRRGGAAACWKRGPALPHFKWWGR